MQSKILLKRILIIVILIGLPLFLILFSQLIIGRLTQSKLVLPIVNVIVPTEEVKINSGLPVRLKIPSIAVDAAFEFVGLTPQGIMDIPKNQDNVAWYELGTRPGEIGSAVVAGHYGTWENGRGSVFDNLNKLRKGDKLFIEDDKGETIYFVVREIRSYGIDANASDIFGSDDGKSHLNLITCEGNWSKDAQSYSKRLVVFTDKE